MTFLNPFLLYGLPLAALPILIHFFARYRRKRIPFSTLHFLKLLDSQRLKRLRLQHLLLMALRTLALACLILGFSRPALQTSGGAGGNRGRAHAVFILDNSFSTFRTVDRTPIFSQSRAAALALLDVFDDDDEIFLLTADRPTIPGPPFQGVTPRHARVFLEDAVPTYRRFDLADALSHARSILNAVVSLGRETFVFSDFQATAFSLEGWEDPAPNLDATLFVSPYGHNRFDNFAVLSVDLESQILEPQKPLTVSVQVGRFGGVAPQDVVLDVYLNGTRTARRSLRLPPNTILREQVLLIPEHGGLLEGFVELEADALPGDNRRYFSWYIDESIQVLLVQPSEDLSPYVSLAVNPAGDAGSRIHVTRIAPAELQNIAYEEFQVVVFNNIPVLRRSEAERLGRARARGLGVFFLLGNRMDVPHYNRDMAATLGLPRIRGVIGRLADPGQAPEAFSSFGRVDMQHPIFQGLFTREPEGRNPPRVFFAFDLESGAEPIIALRDGHGYLVAPVAGRTLVMAGAPTPAHTDLPMKGLFAPLLNRAVRYLAAAGRGANPSVLIGESVSFTLPRLPGNPRIQRPDGTEEIPTIRIQGDAWVLEYAGGNEPGFYHVATGAEALDHFTVNVSPEESDPTPLESTQLAAVWPTGTIVPLLPDLDLVAQVQQHRIGREVGAWLLLAALLFLLVEMLVVHARGPRVVALEGPAGTGIQRKTGVVSV